MANEAHAAIHISPQAIEDAVCVVTFFAGKHEQLPDALAAKWIEITQCLHTLHRIALTNPQLIVDDSGELTP